jgi:chemotaxis protein MotB
MKRIILIAGISASVLSSCVSSKAYNELDSKYSSLQIENRDLNRELEKFRGMETEYQKLQEEHSALQQQFQKLTTDFNALEASHQKLRNSYDALSENSSAAIAENSRQNRELLSQLDEKERRLAAEQARLEKLEKDLDARSRRIDELESLIASKDAKMNALRDAVSKALTNFEGKGLTVEQRDGKVYVSMENKLLFSSGSWAVNAEGRQAVNQLGEVLAQNPDISVLIEGHTDNVPYGGSGALKNNWDLSVKRATSIVEILRLNQNIDPSNLTAAGRGEHAPVATNETSEGKAKNRRIEVILAPKLDEVTKLLQETE